MEGHVNTYGGINQDAAYDSIKPNMYIDAKDIRISTDTGESQGAFTNMKGNTLSFVIPIRVILFLQEMLLEVGIRHHQKL